MTVLPLQLIELMKFIRLKDMDSVFDSIHDKIRSN